MLWLSLLTKQTTIGMKYFLKHSALIFLILLSAGSVEARYKVVVAKPHSVKGKVVVVKPIRPKSMAMRPVNIKTRYIWVDGYW